jgi:acetylornithine deacetylase
MKGGLAAMLTAVKVLKDSGFAPSGDVLLESVVDEEFAGANGTIADRLAGYNADFAINAEPTGLVVCPACVGAHIIKITVQGKAGMPYTGEAIYNPVNGITRVIDILSEYERELADHEVCHPLWQNSPQRDRAVIITKLSAGETGEHGQLGTPIDAWTEVVIQTYPGEESEESFNRFKTFFDKKIKNSQELQKRSITLDREYRYVEPSNCGIDHDGVRVLIGCVEKALGELPKVYGAPFSCDLAAFYKYGRTPACVFGPIGGNLHAPDEWVDIESLEKATHAFVLMIKNWCH